MGVDTLINKKLIAADFISKHIKKGELLDLHSIHGLDADVIELNVNENSTICNKKIGDIEYYMETKSTWSAFNIREMNFA